MCRRQNYSQGTSSRAQGCHTHPKVGRHRRVREVEGTDILPALFDGDTTGRAGPILVQQGHLEPGRLGKDLAHPQLEISHCVMAKIIELPSTSDHQQPGVHIHPTIKVLGHVHAQDRALILMRALLACLSLACRLCLCFASCFGGGCGLGFGLRLSFGLCFRTGFGGCFLFRTCFGLGGTLRLRIGRLCGARLLATPSAHGCLLITLWLQLAPIILPQVALSILGKTCLARTQGVLGPLLEHAPASARWAQSNLLVAACTNLLALLLELLVFLDLAFQKQLVRSCRWRKTRHDLSMFSGAPYIGFPGVNKVYII